jgi:hypothetical protein
MLTVAALFVLADSVYKTLPGVDAWDEARDARRWPGGGPVVARWWPIRPADCGRSCASLPKRAIP